MAEGTTLAAEKREVSGSSAARRLRREGLLPCVLNTDKGESRLLQVARHGFELLLKHHRSESLILDLRVDKEKPMKVLLRAVQHDPLTDETVHADFVEVSMTRKMKVQVPIVLAGEAVGVTQTGGVLEHLLRDLEIECLPGDISESVEVDISHLNIGDTVLVREMTVPSSWTVLADADVAVAAVAAPRVEEEPVVEEEAEAAEEGEPEVIGEKKEEAPAEEGEEPK